jgi:hypothetical protein
MKKVWSIVLLIFCVYFSACKKEDIDKNDSFLITYSSNNSWFDHSLTASISDDRHMVLKEECTSDSFFNERDYIISADDLDKLKNKIDMISSLNIVDFNNSSDSILNYNSISFCYKNLQKTDSCTIISSQIGKLPCEMKNLFSAIDNIITNYDTILKTNKILVGQSTGINIMHKVFEHPINLNDDGNIDLNRDGITDLRIFDTSIFNIGNKYAEFSIETPDRASISAVETNPYYVRNHIKGDNLVDILIWHQSQMLLSGHDSYNRFYGNFHGLGYICFKIPGDKEILGWIKVAIGANLFSSGGLMYEYAYLER